ncbi:hypothetical protein [Massilia sp. CF038]|uniref:hypothetical protein n=1 Tax=Massilia sp. CF038 TaxID=1881045 RepID=UPI000920B43E|nr:hypothetical protein [Massilia sp. CF038]SHG39698.1 hypothetical protein SAMN05428948_0254 [Massilia sp. CF038]
MSGAWRKAGVLGLVLLALLVMVLYNLDQVWSASVDLTHHYALVYRLAEQWSVSGSDPSLGEMNYYPRLGHALAALMGAALDSPFLGMHVVALLCFGSLWAAVGALFASLQRNAALLASLTLALLLYVNFNWFGYQLHGSEVVGNYFFSQLMAQAMAVGALALGAACDVRGRPWHGVAVIVLAIPVVEATHLLPALELLGMLGVLLALRNLPPYPVRTSALVRALASLAVFGAAGAAALYHPAFAAMREIAQNDGRLPLAGLEARWALPLLAVLVLCIAAALLWDSVRARHNANAPSRAVEKYLGAYGVALGTLCLLQLGALLLGGGSSYAVKKYAFGLSSFVVIALALVIGRAAARWLPGQAGPWLCGAAMAALVPASFLFTADQRQMLDGSEMVALERRLVALQAAMPPPPAGKTDVIIDLPDQPMMVNYMFSIAVAHTPRLYGEDLLSKNKLDHAAHYNHIISARIGSRFKNRSCTQGSVGTLQYSDAACVTRSLAAASLCKGTFDFSSAGNVDPAMLTGFSAPEAYSRWTAERSVSFSCTVDKAPRALVLRAGAFLNDKLQQQRVEIALNGVKLGSELMQRPGEVETLRTVLPALSPTTIVTITLTMPDAVAPKALGMGDDGRLLGLNIHSIGFE